MSFMHRNVNFGILMTVVVLALAITVLGIYYTANYSSLSNEYTRQLTSLQKVTQDLLEHKSKLNQTVKDLETTQQDETVLSQKYNQIKDENTRLSSEKQTLQTELQTRTQELATKTNELTISKAIVAEQTAQVNSLKTDVAYYKNKYNDAQDELDAVCAANPGAC
ncbi:MAG: hypothetical protein Q7S65_02115 [Nanoarchaeota archaeon]|nr:hypothetical protein [Nanoarchaeota archaeon]